MLGNVLRSHKYFLRTLSELEDFMTVLQQMTRLRWQSTELSCTFAKVHQRLLRSLRGYDGAVFWTEFCCFYCSRCSATSTIIQSQGAGCVQSNGLQFVQILTFSTALTTVAAAVETFK